MDIRIDENKLLKSNMSSPEVLLLKVLHEHNNLPDIFEALSVAGFIEGYMNDNVAFTSITNTGEMILDRLLYEEVNETSASEDDARLEKIAEAMKEIYPKGFKKDDYGNDAYPWRGSTKMIKDRLRKFEEYYYNREKLDIDDVIEATRRYVDMHKKKDPLLMKEMRLLKYFIYKEGESDLLNYLETEVGEEVYDDSNGMTIL